MMYARRDGSLLVITLWLVTILTALSVAIARYLSLEIKLAKYAMARDQALALARSGVYVAVAELERDASEEQPPVDWTGDDWLMPRAPIAVGDWTLQVSVTDESSKINLNATDPELLTALTALAAPDVAEALLAYRSAETPSDPNEDAPDETPPYLAKDGMMMAMEEALDIPAVRQGGVELYRTLTATTTPYPAGGAPVNIHTASAQVLEALGLSPVTVAAIEQFRTGSDGVDQHAQDGVFTTPAEIPQRLAEPPIGWVIDEHEQAVKEQAILQHLGVESRAAAISATVSREHPPVTARVQAVVARGAASAEGAGRQTIIRWMEE